jgi:cation-transporting P-type ATPase C
MKKFYHFVLKIPAAKEVRELISLEVRARRIPGVVSALACSDGTMSVYFESRQQVSVLKELLHRGKVHSDTYSTAEVSDPEKEARSCKINAIVSLGGFALLEFVKRCLPAFFSKLTFARSAFVILIARNILKNGFEGLVKDHSPNADTLTSTAVIASLLARKPESSLSLLVLSNFAEMLSLSAAEKARKHISHLLGMKEKFLWKIVDGVVTKVPITDVRVNDQVAVYLGEKISVDGIVVGGSASVDQSPLTGEYVPVFKSQGDTVYAGSIIRNGQLIIEASKVGDDTNLARIINMVENAQNRRAPVQNFADRMANMLVPISFIAAGLVYAATRDMQRVLNMFFIDYSCGLKLSTATAISAAISKAAQIGVLVKGGNFIENLSDIDTVVFDKTGTITCGHPEVTDVITAQGVDRNELVSLCASAERNSSHPLAESILNYARQNEIKILENAVTEVEVGRGIFAKIRTDKSGESLILVGSRIFMEENSVAGIESMKIPNDAWNIFYVARDKKIMGAVLVSDPIRKDLKKTINRLRREGIDEILMLTGDSEQNAMSVSCQLDLDGHQANMLPQDKADFIARKQIGSRVIMVGDGINDAPALAYADIGVAMGGKSTDIAIESADITITSDEPLKLPEILKISHRTMNLVRQNFAITIAVNSVALLLGALGRINPLLAATIHNASTVAVVLNSSRILLGKTNLLKQRTTSGSGEI